MKENERKLLEEDRIEIDRLREQLRREEIEGLSTILIIQQY